MALRCLEEDAVGEKNLVWWGCTCTLWDPGSSVRPFLRCRKTIQFQAKACTHHLLCPSEAHLIPTHCLSVLVSFSIFVRPFSFFPSFSSFKMVHLLRAPAVDARCCYSKIGKKPGQLKPRRGWHQAGPPHGYGLPGPRQRRMGREDRLAVWLRM